MTRTIRRTLFALALLSTILLLPADPAQAAPPRGKSYAVSLALLDPITGEIDIDRGCLRFRRNEFCTEFEECGPWEFVEKNGGRNRWTAEILLMDDGEDPIFAEIAGLTERRGDGSSIGGTILLQIRGLETTAAFAGVKVGRAACLEFAASEDE